MSYTTAQKRRSVSYLQVSQGHVQLQALQGEACAHSTKQLQQKCCGGPLHSLLMCVQQEQSVRTLEPCSRQLLLQGISISAVCSNVLDS